MHLLALLETTPLPTAPVTWQTTNYTRQKALSCATLVKELLVKQTSVMISLSSANLLGKEGTLTTVIMHGDGKLPFCLVYCFADEGGIRQIIYLPSARSQQTCEYSAKSMSPVVLSLSTFFC